ncbi:MAG TPA: tRNA epoxyqueuosine(34) reductase QueG [Acidobacteriota bacterium]|nr:tRNA epoxyqueuosine(34) reductase QueG [Acidobacteriota bacterium]
MAGYDLTRRIRSIASELGFEAVGIAPIEALPGDPLDEWLTRNYHGEMQYMARNRDKRLDPRLIFPEARSMVSVALSYGDLQEQPYEEPDRGVISKYAQGEDYHLILEDRLHKLLKRIREIAPEADGRIYVDTGPVMDKAWASRSGIGWLGKHTNILSRALGSWFFLGEIILNLELEYDQAVDDHCGSCSRCIEACPTDAIVEPYVLDSRRCVSYLTIELREDIPVELRKPMGNLIFGCDICQDVCPWNRKSAVPSQVEEFQSRPAAESPPLDRLGELTPEDFSKEFRDSAVKRTKWRGLMRNVAVAMGNSGNSAFAQSLNRLLNTSDAMVRRHAAWALAQLGGQQCLDLLRRRLSIESDADTRSAIEEVLARRPASLEEG